MSIDINDCDILAVDITPPHHTNRQKKQTGRNNTHRDKEKRQTEITLTQKNRQTERKTDRNKYTESQKNRQKETQTYTEIRTERQKNRQIRLPAL